MKLVKKVLCVAGLSVFMGSILSSISATTSYGAKHSYGGGGKLASLPLEANDLSCQKEAWDCGPCGAAKMINYYLKESKKQLATYKDVKGCSVCSDYKTCAHQPKACPHFDIPTGLVKSQTWQKLCASNYMLTYAGAMLGSFRPALIQAFGSDKLGPAPKMLVDHMNSFVKGTGLSFTLLELNGDSDGILQKLAEARPLLVLLKTGESQLPAAFGSLGISGTMPLLHYVVLNGYDSESDVIFYHDTDNQQKSMPRLEFEEKWNWDLQEGVIHDFFEENEVRSGLAIAAL